MPTIHSLAYQPAASSDNPPYQFNRVTAEKVTLIADHGIDGDRKAGHNPNRQLNLLSLATVQALAAEGWKTDPGELGEQIVISDLALETLEPGTRLQLGDSAVIEITMLRVPCNWLGKIHDRDHNSVIGRMGVMARVITGGEVALGAPVSVV